MDISTAVRAGETPGCSNTPSLSPDQNTSMCLCIFEHKKSIHNSHYILHNIWNPSLQIEERKKAL